MIWALLLLAVAGAMPFLREALRPPMDARARETAPGRFATLSRGVTHYRWFGPDNGPVIVCVHGLTTPSFVWESIAPALASRGFRVLTYDLFGRGYSDRPRGRQDTGFFIGQLNDLLDDQRVGSDVTLIGYSMGGVIATAFAAARPGKVRQAVLLAPAGMQALGKGFMRNLLSVPILGLWLFLLRYPRILRAGINAEADLPSSVPDLGKRQLAEVNRRGFLPAVHASLLGALTRPLRSEHETLFHEKIPVLAIWGAEDEVIPLQSKEVLAKWNPEARQAVIDRAGHGVTYTHTPQVLSLIEEVIGPRR